MCKKLQVYLLILDFRENNNNPNFFLSKILSTNFLVQAAWNIPSPELPTPKATLDVGAHVLTASFIVFLGISTNTS